MTATTCEARTRHQRCRTRVRRGGTRRRRGTPLPAHPAVSRHIMPCGFHFFKADSRRLAPTRLRIGPIRACIGWNRPYRPKPPKRPIQAEIQKKKKVQNAPFELNLKPSFSSLHTNTPNFLY